MKYLEKHWRGEAKLWSAFWIVGILGKLMIAIVLPFALYFLASKMQSNTTIDLIKAFGYLIYFAYAIFALVCIWRCSKNTKTAALTALAKVYVMFIPIVVIYSYVNS